MREIVRTTQFKRDFKRVIGSGRNLARFTEALRHLVLDEPMPASFRDHALTGNWSGYRDCHLAGDWLLIYAMPDADTLLLVRTGSHSDLFG
jgi:mRNA interferase YafQ